MLFMSDINIQISSGSFKAFMLLIPMYCLLACRNEAFTQKTEYGEPLLTGYEDCEYNQRRTNEAVYNWTGKVELYDTVSQVYYIRAARPGKIRLDACNLPIEYKKDGMKVQFSGEIKAVLPEEKRIALPFVIAEIIQQGK
jgi:hypothetical protein